MKTLPSILTLGALAWALALGLAQPLPPVEAPPADEGPPPEVQAPIEDAPEVMAEAVLPPDAANDAPADMDAPDAPAATLDADERRVPDRTAIPSEPRDGGRRDGAWSRPVLRRSSPVDAATGNPTSASAASPSGAAKPLRLNFRGAPLDLVLDYLSEAAGFIIVLETEVRGKLDVWSNQPLSKEEAVELLNQVLAKNGYVAAQEGRVLTVMTADDAKKRNTPVRTGSDPAGIPKGDQVITQIIPVRFVNAVQLSRDLQPLFPASATIAANEGGNAVVVTDTQSNIRRIAEIIRALDTAISSVSAVRVFSLKYADAKSLATVIRDLFQAQNAARSGSGQQQQTIRGFRGGGGFPGFPGMPGGQQGGNQGSGGGSSRVSTPGVVAVADERSNALVVSAPEDQMPVIEDLVMQVDVNVDDITELRVFRLEHSDPQEMADLLTELFEESGSSQSNSGRGQFRFGGPGGFFGNRSGSSEVSARQQQEQRVVAVPDLRTDSVVVTAARDLMEQIGQMIAQLDSDPAKKQKVFVFSVENTDPTAVEELLRGLFETQNSRNRTSTSRSSNNRQAGSQLNSRASSNLQNQGRTGMSGSNTGFGSLGGGSNR